MRRGSKRGSNSGYETPAAMAPQTSDGMVATYCPQPTPETQALYNRMRQEEERPNLELLQDETRDMSAGLLQLPSSQAIPASPTPSCASTACSMSRAMNDLHVGEDGSRAKKRRARRNGPLPKDKKLRTAFMRKVGACEECRLRRVKCDHRDLSLFEAAYQAAKLTQDQQLDPAFEPSNTTPYQPSFGDSLDLFGVSDWQDSTSDLAPRPPGGVQNGGTECHGDFDPLSEQMQTQQPVVRPHLAPILSSFTRHAPAVPSSASPLFSLELSPSPPETVFVPIGRRQLAPYGDQWECVYGSDEARSSMRHLAQACCAERCGTVDELKQHYASAHEPFSGDMSMWRCTHCDFDSSEEAQSCPNCGMFNAFRLFWQRWHWAHVRLPSTTISRPRGRVGSQGDVSPSDDRSSWTNHSAQFTNPTGDYGSSPYSASPFGKYGHGYGYSTGVVCNFASRAPSQIADAGAGQKAEAATATEQVPQQPERGCSHEKSTAAMAAAATVASALGIGADDRHHNAGLIPNKVCHLMSSPPPPDSSPWWSRPSWSSSSPGWWSWHCPATARSASGWISDAKAAPRLRRRRHGVCPIAALLALVVLVLFDAVISSSWQSSLTGRIGDGGAVGAPDSAGAGDRAESEAGMGWLLLRVPELSVACILAGSVVPWLVRYLRLGGDGLRPLRRGGARGGAGACLGVQVH